MITDGRTPTCGDQPGRPYLQWDSKGFVTGGGKPNVMNLPNQPLGTFGAGDVVGILMDFSGTKQQIPFTVGGVSRGFIDWTEMPKHPIHLNCNTRTGSLSPSATARVCVHLVSSTSPQITSRFGPSC